MCPLFPPQWEMRLGFGLIICEQGFGSVCHLAFRRVFTRMCWCLQLQDNVTSFVSPHKASWGIVQGAHLSIRTGVPHSRVELAQAAGPEQNCWVSHRYKNISSCHSPQYKTPHDCKLWQAIVMGLSGSQAAPFLPWDI